MYSRETDDRRYRMSNSNVSHNNGNDDTTKMVIANIVIDATKKLERCPNAQTHRTLLTFLISVCLLLLTGPDAVSGFVVEWIETNPLTLSLICEESC